ncbi:hypothetical protein FNH07_02885 [Amycolatopsis bartoniae]|nr:hypothetical protein FNH07_02885 [Amycolatopsis bartoniae]
MREGEASWTVDRDFGDAVLGESPELRQIAKANRVFLHRMVRYRIGKGIAPVHRERIGLADDAARTRGRRRSQA